MKKSILAVLFMFILAPLSYASEHVHMSNVSDNCSFPSKANGPDASLGYSDCKVEMKRVTDNGVYRRNAVATVEQRYDLNSLSNPIPQEYWSNSKSAFASSVDFPDAQWPKIPARWCYTEDKSIASGSPVTTVYSTLNWVVTVKIVTPNDENGNPISNLRDMTFELTCFDLN